MEQSLQSSCERSWSSDQSFLGGRQRKTRGPTNTLLMLIEWTPEKLDDDYVMKETQSPGWKICVEAPKCDPAVPRRPTDCPLTGVAPTAKLNGSEVKLDPNKNSAQTDPTRPAHLSLRILSCVCAGTFHVFAATRGKSQEGVSRRVPFRAVERCGRFRF